MVFRSRTSTASSHQLSPSSNRSPSCAIKDTKEYPDAENPSATGKGAGLFAEKVVEKFPGAAIEDEGRLRNTQIREHYLTRIFALARWRETKKKRSRKALVDFQSDNKFVLLSYNQKEMRELGRIVGNKEGLSIDETIGLYDEHLKRALARFPRRNSNINVLMHGMGYFSDELLALLTERPELDEEIAAEFEEATKSQGH